MVDVGVLEGYAIEAETGSTLRPSQFEQILQHIITYLVSSHFGNGGACLRNVQLILMLYNKPDIPAVKEYS